MKNFSFKLLLQIVGLIVTTSIAESYNLNYLDTTQQLFRNTHGKISQFDSLIAAGDVFFYKGQYDSAHAVYQRAYLIAPNNESAIIGLYHCALYSNHIKEAALWAESLQARFPSLTNCQRMAYTAGLLGKSKNILKAARASDSSAPVYWSGINGLLSQKQYWEASRISKKAFIATADSSFLQICSYGNNARTYPSSSTIWAYAYSFNPPHNYKGGYAGGISINYFWGATAIGINTGQYITEGRSTTKKYTINYFLDSVQYTSTVTDKWRYTAPQTGFDSSVSIPPYKYTNTIALKDDSVFQKTIYYYPKPIRQNDLHMELIHNFSSRNNGGVGFRYTTFTNEQFTENLMGNIFVSHSLRLLVLQHRITVNSFKYQPLIDEPHTIYSTTTSDTVFSILWDTAYVNQFGAMEFDSLQRVVIDTVTKYNRWTWIEQKLGAPIFISSLQYDNRIDVPLNPVTLSLDGSIRYIFTTNSKITDNIFYYTGVSIFGNWNYVSFKLAIHRGNLFLLDRSFSISTIRGSSKYALEAGFGLAPSRQFAINYNFRYDELYSSKAHLLLLTFWDGSAFNKH